MKGTFWQEAAHPYVALRRDMLDSGRRYRAPFASVPAEAAAPTVTAAVVATRLREHGIGVVTLDRPMTNAEFRAFGAVLGTAQPERSPDVRAMVENEVILNLRTEYPATADPARQPFAANSLSLHSESSGAAPAAQPRYIVLMCVSPGADPSAGQTVVVPMTDVYVTLSGDTRQLLARTRYDLLAGTPPTILRHVGARPVFSFRDFLDAPLNWTTSGTVGARAEVERALIQLYSAMYGHGAFGFSWRRGLLVAIDNTRYFHGRTSAPPPVPGQARHLKRLRIAAEERS